MKHIATMDADLFTSIILLAFGLALVIWIVPAQVGLPNYKVTMSPRLLPELCGGAISLLSAVRIGARVFSRERKDTLSLQRLMSKSELRSVLGITSLFAFCIALFVYVSPLIAAAVLIVGLMVLLGERNIVLYVVLPVAYIATAYVIFYHVLGTAVG